MNMSWNTRKHFDDESRQKLLTSIPDSALLSEVEAAYNDSMSAVERKEAELHQVYETIPNLLAQNSKVSGISQETLLVITRRIATTSRDLEWYQVLSMVNSFYRIKETLESEKQ